MAEIINTNMQSMMTQRYLSSSSGDLSQAMQRLSSGLRINSALDDAAGLAIANRMTSQARGLTVAQRNANDAISLAQTAEGVLGGMNELLLRMRDLAVQSANGTNDASSRTNLQSEYKQLSDEVARIYKNTTFNGKYILYTGAGVTDYQVGANATSGDRISVTSNNFDSLFTATAATNISADAAAATAAIAAIDKTLESLSTERATYGAAQSRFNSVLTVLQISVENQTAAASRILDADYAAETAAMSRAQILRQAGTAMLAQANVQPNTVLTLLRSSG